MAVSLLHRIGYALLRWPPISEGARKAALGMVRSRDCVCGAKKVPGFPFCKPCFENLPSYRQDALGMMLRRGFTLTYLRTAKKVRKTPKEAQNGLG